MSRDGGPSIDGRRLEISSPIGETESLCVICVGDPAGAGLEWSLMSSSKPIGNSSVDELDWLTTNTPNK